MPGSGEKSSSASKSGAAKKVRMKSKSKKSTSDEAVALALRAIIQATSSSGENRASGPGSPRSRSHSNHRSSSRSGRSHEEDEGSDDATNTDDMIGEYHKMQRTMLDRIDSLEGKIFLMKNFTEEIHRSVIDMQRGFEDRLAALETTMRGEIEDERNKRLKLIRSVHKLDEEEMNKTRAKIEVVQEDAERRLRDQDAAIRSATEEVSRLRNLMDELVSNNSVGDEKGANNETETALELRVRRIEKRMGLKAEGGTGTSSPSARKASTSSSVHSNSDSSEKLVGALSLRLEDLERTVASLSRASTHAPPSAAVESAIKETKDELKLMGKNTSKACRALSAGLSDVQHATLLLYSWADKVHKSFETVSYKLEYPMNVCPRVRIDLANHPGSFNQISDEFDSRYK